MQYLYIIKKELDKKYIMWYSLDMNNNYKGVIKMKDVQDFVNYHEAVEYAESMNYVNGYIILPFAEGWTVFEC